MATVKNFEELDIWKAAIDLGTRVYKITSQGKLSSDWGMKDQIRRSVASISNNIAEGFEYNNNKHFVRFLSFAKGSTGEFRNQLILLNKSGMLEDQEFNELYQQTVALGSSIGKFMSYLKSYIKEQDTVHTTRNNQ